MWSIWQLICPIRNKKGRKSVYKLVETRETRAWDLDHVSYITDEKSMCHESKKKKREREKKRKEDIGGECILGIY